MRFWRIISTCLIVAVISISFFFVQKILAAPGTSALVGYWKLDETTQGSNATDSSGYSNTGTPTGTGGGPTYSTDVPYTTFPDSHSASFNGTDQYINCGDSPTGLPTGSAARTIAAWIKATSFADSNGKTVAGWGNDSGGELSELAVSTNSKIEFHGNGNDVLGSTTLQTGQWYHLTATVTSAGAVKLYVNGVQDGTGTVSLNTTEANCKIGRQPNFDGQYFNGLIDDVRIYSRVLSATEIADLAHGNHTTATWTGSSSTNFETAGNWDINAVPEPFTKFVIASTTNKPVFSANEQFGGLTINSGGILNLSGFNLTMNDYVAGESGLATSSGTIISKNSETLTNFVLPTSAGTVMYNNTSSATGLLFGNTYNNLIFNDGLIGYWKLDEALKTDSVIDSSGYGLNGTSASIESGGPTPSTDIPSVNFANSKSRSFGGTDYIEVANNSNLNPTSALTLSAWIKLASTDSNYHTIAGKWYTATNQQYLIQINSDGKIGFWTGDGGTCGDDLESTNTMSSGNWILVTATQDGTSKKLYINGSLDTNKTSSCSLGTSAALFGIGSKYNSSASYFEFFNGNIDDVRVYNRALSSTEVTALGSGNEPGTSLATTTLNHDLTTNGNLILNSGTLDVSGSNYGITDSGNFENNGGVFTARSGTVTLNATDGQTINSSNTFYNLTRSPISSDHLALTFGAGSTQTITNTLSLNGTSGGLLGLHSSTTGTQWKIDPQGTRNISYVGVSDSNNINATAIAYSSTNNYQTNLTNWTTSAPTPTPTPSGGGSGSSSSSSTSSQSCPSSVPSGTPNLYQLDPTTTSITLYFTPVSGADSYYISYGTTRTANQFATSFSNSNASGAIAYTVGSLQPGTTYYFQVRAGNGCATGNWSTISSSTTGGNVVSSKKLIITSSKLTTQKSNVCTYTVKSGDSLWSIAQSMLGDGTKYTILQDLNKNSSLDPGMSIQLPCDRSPETIAKAQQEVQQPGVSLDIKVLAMNNAPVVGAIVTLHSKVQMAKTDANGIAHFTNVENGEHKVLLAYNGYNGSQSLRIDGTKKQQTLTLQVQLQGFSYPLVIAVVGILLSIIIVLVVIIFLLIKKSKKEK